jgi:two-component system chemotaxis sensor kinase CheA
MRKGVNILDDSQRIDSLLDMYLFETTQLMSQLEQMILVSELEGSINNAAINEIFRIMHTTKSSSAMMMFHNLSKLAHSIEDIFYYIREEQPVIITYSPIFDIILEVIDFTKDELENIKCGKQPDKDETELITKHKEYLEVLKKSNTNAHKEKNILNDYTWNSSILEVVSSNPMRSYRAIIYFSDGCGMENIRGYGIILHLNDLANEITHIPVDLIDDNSSADKIIMEGLIINFKSSHPYNEINQFFQNTIFLKDMELIQLDDTDCFNQELSNVACNMEESLEILDIKNHKTMDGMDVSRSGQEVLSTGTGQSFISVSVSKLDKLLDLVGEMVIAEVMVINNPDLNGLQLNNFPKAAYQLNKISNEIKDMVMSIRMVPLSVTFHKMHRIVRDMSKKLQKELNLQIVGEETEVDKNIIENISDPLMHLIRNAVDHGIETAEERRLSGKPEVGIVTIEAKNVGSDVVIIIRDDGRGLDKEKILNKAKENNLLLHKEDQMSDKEIFNLILLPGFSTKDNITEFSGRGVGMDVVTKNIEKISGSISINSELGKGSTFTIKIPLTLAIIDAMNIKVGASCYSIPTIFIQESFRMNQNQLITDPDGNEMIMIRGNCYPLIKLHTLFGVATDVTEYSEGIIIMIQQDNKSVCLLADELIGQMQIVVKSIPKYVKQFKKNRGISGCTLLGDGSISLIIDVAFLINQ